MSPRSYRLAGAGLLALVLAGLPACSSILPGRAAAPDVYQLSPVTVDKASGQPLPLQLVVNVPLAARGLDSDRIVVRSDPYEIKYLAGARWSDTAPRLVQSALVQALESAGGFAGIGRPEDGLKSSYDLVSDLRAFDILNGAHTHVSAVLAVKLVRAGGDVVAMRVFTQDVAASGTSENAVVAAYDAAMKTVAGDVAKWALEAARRMPRAAVPPALAPVTKQGPTDAAAPAPSP